MSLDYPTSKEELFAQARSYSFSPQVSIRLWFNTANSVLAQARTYDLEGEFIMAYILYYRYADLVTDKLPTHPDYQSKIFASKRKECLSELQLIVARLEDLRLPLEQQLMALREERVRAEESRKRASAEAAAAKRAREIQAQAKARVSQTPAVDRQLSLNERLGSLRQGQTHSPYQQRESQLTNTYSQAPAIDSDFVESLNRFKKSNQIDPFPQSSFKTSTDSWYPSPMPSKPISKPASEIQSSRQPSIPSLSNNETPDLASVEHKVLYHTEKGDDLRTVFIPENLRQTFLEVAQPNTSRNLETCAMLCGVLSRNAFFITQLVVPEQESTPDTCQTTNEESLFEYVERENILIIGWIHTHPTQTCFLSSVDLHSQCSYQIMLPEAVAIVCAPRHEPSWGAFRLTDPPGLDIIKKCRQSLTFHPHPEPDIYAETSSPRGHLHTNKSLKFKVKDLRR